MYPLRLCFQSSVWLVSSLNLSHPTLRLLSELRSLFNCHQSAVISVSLPSHNYRLWSSFRSDKVLPLSLPPSPLFLLLHFTFSLCFLILRRLRCASSLKLPMRKRPWGSWVFAFVFHFLPKQFYLTPSSSSALFHSLSVNQRSMKDCLCVSDINRHIWSEIKMFFLSLSRFLPFWQVTSNTFCGINDTKNYETIKWDINKIWLVTFYITVLSPFQ